MYFHLTKANRGKAHNFLNLLNQQLKNHAIKKRNLLTYSISQPMVTLSNSTIHKQIFKFSRVFQIYENHDNK